MTGRAACLGTLLLAMVAGACGEDAPPPMHAEPSEPVVPVATPEPSLEPTAPAPTTPATEVAAPEPTERSFAVFALPDDWEEVLEARTVVDFEVIELDVDPNYTVVPRFDLDAPVGSLVDAAIADAAAPSPDSDDVIDTRCDATLASPRLVSMTCRSSGSGGRTGFDRGYFPLSYAIDGNSIRQVVVEDAVAPGEDLVEVARRACREQASEDEVDPVVCASDFIVTSFADRGFEVHAYHEYDDARELTALIPYDAPELEGRLLVNGPLGAVLPVGARRTVVVSAEVALSFELRAHPWGRWTFGPTRSLELAARASVALQTSGAFVAPADGGFRSGYTTRAGSIAEFREAETSARAAAGGPLTRIDAAAPSLETDWMKATEELALRSGPGTESPLIRTVPLGTTLLAVEGELEGHVSRAGGRGSWVRVFVTEGVGGWVAGRYLASSTCPPSALPLSALPEAARAFVAGALFGQVPGHVFAVVTGTDRSWVLDAANCGYERVTRVVEVSGRIETLRWLAGGRSDPELLLVTSSARGPGEPGFDGTTRWSLVAPGATTAGWSTEARGHPSVPENERATMETRVRSGRATWDVVIHPVGQPVRRARWTGTEFLESTGP